MSRTVDLAPKPASVRSARVFTADVLGEGGVESTVVELAVLLVSELVTNATVHARSKIRVTVHVDTHWVRIEVDDEGSGRPVLRSTSPTQIKGRGLSVVDRLSTDWGTDEHEDYKTVWFEIAR
jgi:anti-sigma regulatory factor (Ser/Thr protein kinase)